MLKKLESLYPQSNGWSITRARKAHIDHFGVKIEEGEQYYSRSIGAIGAVRLSDESFNKFIELLFDNNPQLEEIADVIEERRFDRMREAVEKTTIDIKSSQII